ncbi:MAG: hypothetical protein NTX65_10535 [Ignavibacteriales bacterium]|nr:hypothetical protein [Ignavibacteriales bacterium]
MISFGENPLLNLNQSKDYSTYQQIYLFGSDILAGECIDPVCANIK